MKKVKLLVSLLSIISLGGVLSLTSCQDNTKPQDTQPEENYDVSKITILYEDQDIGDTKEVRFQLGSIKLKALVEGNSEVVPQRVKWKSSDSKIATASTTGYITFKKQGIVTITCTSYFDETVSDSVTLSIFEKADVEINKIGEYKLEAEAADLSNATSSSSNAEIIDTAPTHGAGPNAGKPASDTSVIKNLSVIGNEIKYTIKSEAYARGNILLRGSSSNWDGSVIKDAKLDDLMAMYLDGNQVLFGDNAVFPGCEYKDYMNLQDTYVYDFLITPGMHTWTIESKVDTSISGVRAANFDYFVFQIDEYSKDPLPEVVPNEIKLDENFQTNYLQSEVFKGGKLIATYDGYNETIDVTPEMVKGFDTSTPGNKEITITYKGKEIKVTISVQALKSLINGVSVATLEAETDFDLYEYKNALTEENYNKLFTDGNSKDPNGNVVVGLRNLCQDNGTLNLSIKANFLSSGNAYGDLTFRMAPSVAKGNVGIWDMFLDEVIEISLNGEVIKADGVLPGLADKKNYFNMSDLTIKNVNFKKGINTLSIKVIVEKDVSTGLGAPNFDNVKLDIKKYSETEDVKAPTVEEISINGGLKTDYQVDEEFNNDGSLNVKWSDGSTSTQKIVRTMVSGFDSSTEGEKEISISYRGQLIKTKVNVTAPVEAE